MKKIVNIVLSICLALLSLAAVGCGEYRPPSGGFTPGESVEDSSSGGGAVRPDDKTQPFTVTLNPLDGGTLKGLNNIKAIWTDATGGGLYEAPFDENGVAASYKPDGEYQITLSEPPTGYTYDPNVHFADNLRKERTIDLYPLRTPTGGDGTDYNAFKADVTGAYRFTFNKPTEEYYFTFGASHSGLIRFESLLDVTQNEILPVFYECFSPFLATVRLRVVGGGASNSYTKNFRCDYNLTGSQAKLFKIGVETVNPKAFPVSIDLLITGDDYINSDSNLEVVPAPVDLPTADSIESVEGKTFHLIADDNGKLFDEDMVVYDKEDGYYYVKDAEGNPDRSKRLFARLARDVMGVFETYERGTNRHVDQGLSYYEIRHKCYLTPTEGKDYTDFANAYFAKVNSDGSYPVDKALKEYLYDFCLSKQLFFDGYGSSEGEGMGGYKTDGPSRWLFVCGYYA